MFDFLDEFLMCDHSTKVTVHVMVVRCATQAVDEILKCRAVLPCGDVYSTVSTSWFYLLRLRLKSSNETDWAVLFIMVYKVILTF